MNFHENNGKCSGCQKIFDRYPNFYSPLRYWFESLQAEHPEAHVSCAGRGKMDQEMCFCKKSSRAHFGHSGHNANAAIDIFREAPTVKGMYDQQWFDSIIEPALKPEFEWYGAKGAQFYERPHIEVRGWAILLEKGELVLVE